MRRKKEWDEHMDTMSLNRVAQTWKTTKEIYKQHADKTIETN